MIIMVFLIGALAVAFPFILGGVIGLVWGGLTKLGYVGKGIATLIMVVIGGILGIIPLVIGSVFSTGWNDIIFAALVVSGALLIPVWYFFWHHDAVKEMGIVAFGFCLKICFVIVWYGGGFGMIVAMFNQTVGAIIAIAALISGIVYYVVATRDSEEMAERDRSFDFRWIGIGVAAVIAAVLSIVVGNAITTEKNNLEAGIYFEASTKKQKELVTQYSAGRTVTCNEEFTLSDYGYGKLLTEPTLKSSAIRELKPNERLTTTGEVRFDTKYRTSTDEVWLQLTDNEGVTGWVNMMDLHWSAYPGENITTIEAIEETAANIIGTWIDDENNQWVFENTGKMKIGEISMDYTVFDDKRIFVTFSDHSKSEFNLQMSADGKSMTISYSNDGGNFSHRLSKR